MIRYERTATGWIARCDVRAGIDRIPIAVDLGALDREPDAAGLRGTPVLAVASASLPVARAGALRAGAAPAVLLLPGDAPRIGGQLLLAVDEGVEVILVEDGGPDALTTARALGGTPVVPLPGIDDEVLASLRVDVSVIVPTARRQDRRRIAASPGPTSMHHLVDVDPAPAFDELGWDVDAAPPEDVAAGAAGVFAGRLAVGNRRWRTGTS